MKNPTVANNVIGLYSLEYLQRKVEELNDYVLKAKSVGNISPEMKELLLKRSLDLTRRLNKAVEIRLRETGIAAKQLSDMVQSLGDENEN